MKNKHSVLKVTYFGNCIFTNIICCNAKRDTTRFAEWMAGFLLLGLLGTMWRSTMADCVSYDYGGGILCSLLLQCHHLTGHHQTPHHQECWAGPVCRGYACSRRAYLVPSHCVGRKLNTILHLRYGHSNPRYAAHIYMSTPIQGSFVVE